MKLPRGEHAVVDLAKLRDYRRNPVHPRGRHKARVFASALGLTKADAVFLYEELRRAARELQAAESHTHEYGERYTLDFEFVRGNRRAMVRSAWIGPPRRTNSTPDELFCTIKLDPTCPRSKCCP